MFKASVPPNFPYLLHISKKPFATLRHTEEYMLDYLGFPHQQEDVDKFVSAVDRLEPDGKISPEEFLKTVGIWALT